MKRYVQYDYINVEHFCRRRWDHPVHNHNHFEIIYIPSGKGTHCIAGRHYHFTAPALFLLAPGDAHHFVLDEETEFTFFKFTTVFWKGFGSLQFQQQWNREIDQVLLQASQQEQKTWFFSQTEWNKLDQLCKLIVVEWQKSPYPDNEALFLLMQTLFVYFKRNLRTPGQPVNRPHDERVLSMLAYLHEQIYDPEKTSAEHLSVRFHLAKNYLGSYFKQHMGLPLSAYINAYKINLIRNRLQFSSFSLKEISQEFGFTDSSHFYNYFKRYVGIAPSAFRKQQAGLQQGEPSCSETKARQQSSSGTCLPSESSFAG